VSYDGMNEDEIEEEMKREEEEEKKEQPRRFVSKSYE
jgi:hypothetical protein